MLIKPTSIKIQLLFIIPPKDIFRIRTYPLLDLLIFCEFYDCEWLSASFKRKENIISIAY